jgi:hypothetical protein
MGVLACRHVRRPVWGGIVFVCLSGGWRHRLSSASRTGPSQTGTVNHEDTTDAKEGGVESVAGMRGARPVAGSSRRLVGI